MFFGEVVLLVIVALILSLISIASVMCCCRVGRLVIEYWGCEEDENYIIHPRCEELPSISGDIMNMTAVESLESVVT